MTRHPTLKPGELELMQLRQIGEMISKEKTMREKRFTIDENSTGFYIRDNGNTMEDLEVKAEQLNLLDRIAEALENIANSIAMIEGRS